MKISDLHPAEGSRKRKRRVGRGPAAGQGKTAGRGTKGQKARKGGAKAPYFEGGQLPLVRRLPFKRGFTNVFRVLHQEVNLDRLQERFPEGGAITPVEMAEKGLIRDANENQDNEQQLHAREKGETIPVLVITFAPAP